MTDTDTNTNTDSSVGSTSERKKRKRSKEEKKERKKKRSKRKHTHAGDEGEGSHKRRHKHKHKKHKHKHKHKQDHKKKHKQDPDSTEDVTPNTAQAAELFRMILAIEPSAKDDLLYMLKRFARGKSVTVGAKISSVQIKELLLSAFKCLEIKQIAPDKYQPRARADFLQDFTWIKDGDSAAVVAPPPVGPKAPVNAVETGISKPDLSKAIGGLEGGIQDASSSSEGDDEGPQPVSAGKVRVPTAAALRQSAEGVEEREGKNGKPQRHEWMTVLPEGGLSKSIGFLQQPRQFSQSKASASPRNSSAWTQLPGGADGKDKTVKTGGQQIESIMPKANARADETLRKQMKAFNEESRGVSLLEEHKSVKKEGEDGKKAFSWNREKDMAFAKIDPKRTREIVDGAKDLSSRFARPKTSRQFL